MDMYCWYPFVSEMPATKEFLIIFSLSGSHSNYTTTSLLTSVIYFVSVLFLDFEFLVVWMLLSHPLWCCPLFYSFKYSFETVLFACFYGAEVWIEILLIGGR